LGREISQWSFVFRKVNQGPAEQVPIDKKASNHAEGMPKLAYKADGTCVLLYEMNRPTAASRFNGDLLYAMEVNGVWQKLSTSIKTLRRV